MTFEWIFGGFSECEAQLIKFENHDDVIEYMGVEYRGWNQDVCHWTHRKFLSMAGQRIVEVNRLTCKEIIKK
jgi:hypothetical protein